MSRVWRHPACRLEQVNLMALSLLSHLELERWLIDHALMEVRRNSLIDLAFIMWGTCKIGKVGVKFVVQVDISYLQTYQLPSLPIHLSSQRWKWSEECQICKSTLWIDTVHQTSFAVAIWKILWTGVQKQCCMISQCCVVEKNGIFDIVHETYSRSS